MTLRDEERFEHESFGMIGITNCNSNIGIPLFGSSIKHDRFISLKIMRGDVTRNLHREWYYGKETIIEVYLSAAQFTNFITSPNMGQGVPCTIKFADGKEMSATPYFGQNEMFAQELDADFKKAMQDTDTLIKDAREILSKKGALRVSEKKELLGKIESLAQHIKANIPFLHKQFTRAMDKTVNAAKIEIEGFYTSTIMKLGKRALAKLNKPKLPRIEK